MAVFQCVVPAGAVPRELRPRIASEFTRIHSETTGAAPDFVQVLFLEMPVGSAFTAGEPSAMHNVTGYMRAGRSREMREQLYRQLHGAWTKITGAPSANVKLTIYDVPTAWIMQDGRMMPEPKDDAEWLARQSRPL